MDSTPHSSRIASFRNAFISGVLLLLPLAITVWAFTLVIDVVGGRFRPLYEHYLPDSWKRIPVLLDVLATGVVVLLVTLLGFLSSYVLGKYFLSIFERFIRRIPAIGTLYNSVKQLIATIGKQNKNLFNKVVLIEFPRKGMWAIGFLTNKQQGEPQLMAGQESWMVFLPTTPNPTSGYLLVVPARDVVELEMSVADGMKMIISGGAVIPPWPPDRKPEAIAGTTAENLVVPGN